MTKTVSQKEISQSEEICKLHRIALLIGHLFSYRGFNLLRMKTNPRGVNSSNATGYKPFTTC